jgi:NitT/TauT family transport system ATP-binding protein
MNANGDLLQFANVSKVFETDRLREVRALDDVSFSLKPGEFISIIGPSGCGKSTVLRLAAGLDYPTSGEILYHGRRIGGPDHRRGFVFQAYNAFPWLTVRKNIAFGLGDVGSDGSTEKVASWLRFTGLTEFADRYPKALSGGMLQRLALARTMIVEPELLLLDEPFGALDERTRESMQRLLLEVVNRSGCSVLFVTHDIREAILLGDRVILFSARPGRIKEIFPTPLDKPRSRAHVKSPEFMALYERILDEFPV